MDQDRQTRLYSVEIPFMPLRIAVLVAVVMAATAAVAEPDALSKIHRWLWPNSSQPVGRTEPVVIERLPDLPPPEIAPAPALESPIALPRPRPKIVEKQPKPKAKAPLQITPLDDSPVECWKVQWGASMSCDVIRANEHIYESYSLRRKCASRACLTPEQIKGIESCFSVKKPKLRCP